MSEYAISLHVKDVEQDDVLRTINTIFLEEGFGTPVDMSAAVTVADENEHKDDGGYGVFVGGKTTSGWVSCFVDDWQDSGYLAKRLSDILKTNIIEIWMAESVHWGYTLFFKGAVADRFADDPWQIAESPSERDLYRGNEQELAFVAGNKAEGLIERTRTEQSRAEDFAGAAIAELAAAIGLPFEHGLIGYSDFFEEDPADYSQDLEAWHTFRHLSFGPPAGREQLAP